MVCVNNQGRYIWTLRGKTRVVFNTKMHSNGLNHVSEKVSAMLR